MVGFPQHRLETYLTMLTDRGYDVEVNSLEDGERSTRTVVSTTKEAPVESKPIGRIDYLSTDARSVKASSTPARIALRRTSRRKTTTVSR